MEKAQFPNRAWLGLLVFPVKFGRDFLNNVNAQVSFPLQKESFKKEHFSLRGQVRNTCNVLLQALQNVAHGFAMLLQAII